MTLVYPVALTVIEYVPGAKLAIRNSPVDVPVVGSVTVVKDWFPAETAAPAIGLLEPSTTWPVRLPKVADPGVPAKAAAALIRP